MARKSEVVVARCIIRAILKSDDQNQKKSLLKRIIAWLAAFFALYKILLHKFQPILFADLRKRAWHIDEARYSGSFIAEDGANEEDSLQTMDAMGYSGSTFFSTKDQTYLIKSIPRQFEHSFFRDDLLGPYAEYMAEHQDSLLIRICDLLAARSTTLGIAFGLAPSHHIVMENLLYGQAEAQRKGEPAWESWDLKPINYFFPERDIASGTLASEATKSKLADKFDDKLMLRNEDAEQFIRTLERDTALLQDRNAVDYSLFLVRIRKGAIDPFQDPEIIPDDAPFVPPASPSWRTGIPSTDGIHIYRAAVLDFFWAKHKMQPRLMTALIKAYNLLDRQGHMSITTSPTEYRTRFLDMCRSFIEVSE